MRCDFIKFPGGGSGVICTRSRPKRLCFYGCGNVGTIECDYPIPPEGKTCDRLTCRDHAERLAANLDYCQGHAPFYAGPVQSKMVL